MMHHEYTHLEYCEGPDDAKDSVADDEACLTSDEVEDHASSVLDGELHAYVQGIVAKAHAQVSGRPSISIGGGNRAEGAC